MKVSVFFVWVDLSFCLPQQPKIPDDFDYGRIEDGVYKNDYFNMKVSLPAAWGCSKQRANGQAYKRRAKSH